MGLLNFFGLKDNVQKASENMADIYLNYSMKINPYSFTPEQKYITTFTIVYPLLFNSLLKRIQRDGFQYHQLLFKRFLENRLVNLKQFVAADLNINAAPKRIPFEETLASFENEIAQYLINKGILPCFVSEDNSDLTFELVAKYTEQLR